ncbi:MAG: GGDEF domain-containing protein, partial [Psychrosphaera sp.]|nr:GGDEF domain-containing protein [Psychrosphaera sp.]
MRVFEDNKGFLWIATIDGLNRYDQKNKRFVRYHHDKDDTSSLSHDGVISIAQDNERTLWVGTHGGLNKFDSQTQSFKQYRVKDGLPNNVIYAILPDNEGHIWLSTNAGLSKFNPQKETFKNYDVNDGLQSNEFNAGTAFKSSDGEFYFGGINGYNHFYPSTITDDTLPPKVVLTEFLLFNQPVPVLNPLNTSQQDTQFTLPQSIGSLTDLTLDHQHNLLTFEFAALDFSNPMKNRYAYKLEGQDQNWITASAKNRRATYTNLAAGDYTLRVKAANPDGYWNEQGTSIKIHVNPAPWLSWWAYALYWLLASAMMYGVYRYQIARIRLRNEQRKIENERSVHQRLKQVDKLKDAFLANTSHELRTPLNGIIGLAESLVDGIAGPLPDKANKNLNMVITSGKRLANLVNDILDLSKLKHASIVLNTRSVDIHALADVVLTLSKPLVGDKDLALVNAVPNTLPVVAADEDRLLQIMHNLVGNAI